MKILLVGMGRYLSLFGVRILSGYMNSLGHDTSICFIPVANFQSMYKQECDDFGAFVKEIKPDLIGFSLMFCDALRAARLTRAVKQATDIPVIWGGLHPSICPEDTPDTVDYICIGEGEIPFKNLVEAMSSGNETTQIPGIWARQNNVWHRNNPGPRYEILDDLPFPDYRENTHFILENGKYQILNRHLLRNHLIHSAHVHSVLTTRGCPYQCTYCANSAIAELGTGAYLRRRSPSNVIAEMKAVLTQFPYILGLIISDDLFISAPNEWLEEFSEEYKREIKVPFFCEIHPKYVTRERILLLKSTGLSGVGMGIQSGSDRICQEVFGRDTSRKQINESVQILDETAPDIARFYDFIVDNPFATEEETVESIKLANSFQRNFDLSIFPLLFYPGTALSDQAEEKGILEHQENLLTGESCKYKPSFLNRILRTLPKTRAAWITYWVNNRTHFFARFLFHLYYFGYFVSFRKFFYNLKKFILISLSMKLDPNRTRKAKRILRFIKL